MEADKVSMRVAQLVSGVLKKAMPAAAASGGFVHRGPADRRLATSCLQAPVSLTDSKEETPRQQFVLDMELAVDKAVAEAEERSWTLMEAAARPCQKLCRRAVVKLVADNLWDTGTLARGNSDELAQTALQGALAACLPNLPEGAAEKLAGESLISLLQPKGEKASSEKPSPSDVSGKNSSPKAHSPSANFDRQAQSPSANSARRLLAQSSPGVQVAEETFASQSIWVWGPKRTTGVAFVGLCLTGAVGLVSVIRRSCGRQSQTELLPCAE